MRRTLLALIVIAAAVPGAQVRTDIEVRGRVVAAENGVALPRARITVVNAGAAVEPVFSDDWGRFVLHARSTPGVRLRLTVAKAGFAARYLQLSPANLRETREIEFRLARGAAIGGRVVTHAGAIVSSAAVLVRPIGVADGTGTPPVAVRTDDLGEYRVGGLHEGRYTVQLLDGMPLVRSDLAFTVAPGAGALAVQDSLIALNRDLVAGPSALPPTTGEAITLAVRAGDEVTALDLVMTAPGRMMSAPDRVGACNTSRGIADPHLTASISGRVVDTSGRPLACASVTLHGSTGPAFTVSTGPDGRFVHDRLPADTFMLQAQKQGYAVRRYGESRTNPRGRPIALRRGQSLSGIDVVLPRRSAVTGRVLNDLGEPVSGVSVRAFQIRSTGDLTMAVYAPGIGVRSTDDRGRYRLFGFPPGRYLIGVSFEATVTGPDGVYGYTPMFYPATTDVATASPLDVAEEGDIVGVNLIMVRSPARRITGIAVDADGGAAREVLVFPSVRSSGILVEPRRAAVGADGSFSIPNLAPGEYVVQAAGGQERTDGYGVLPPDFGMSYVTVGEVDPPPATVRAAEGVVVEGQMFARGGEVQLRQLLFENDVWLWPLEVDPDRSWAVPQPRRGFALLDGGRFRVSGVTGVRRFVLERAPEEWYAESVSVNGRDALNAPFDFTSGPARFSGVEAVLSDDAAIVTSRVVDARGAVVPSASAIVFATDRNLWFRESQHVRVGRRQADGTIRVGSLPPGEYFITGYDPPDVVSFRFGGWLDTRLLDQLARVAERVTLEPRDRRHIVLTVPR